MLIEFAHKEGRAFTEQLTRMDQKVLGQFMTPPAIARFMADRLVADVELPHVRVLEPAAGAGILAAAVIEALLAKETRPHLIELYLFEYDEGLLPSLRKLGDMMTEACKSKGVTLDLHIQHGDFLLSQLALSGKPVEGLLTIANPPFFKLNKTTDLRAELHAYAVYGQPNIYSLFQAACARLTPANGRWCFITPRSWMSGWYFKAARQTMLRFLKMDSLHAFDSRREGFEEDSVLQETMIAWARGRTFVEQDDSILLTRSQGASDLDTSLVQAVPANRIVGTGADPMLSLPAVGADPFDGWTATLATYGLEVSTGPIVAFRLQHDICEYQHADTVPLLWLQHVGQQSIRWPINKKREHIRAYAENMYRMVRNQPMVLLRRFSPKEDERRITCAAYACDFDRLPGAVLGLENHLNYIHRPGGTMTNHEARGLSGFLASKLVDEHFRALAGSTQVNATEIRKLPLPPLETIEEIGRALSNQPSLSEIDEVVTRALGVWSDRKAAA